MTGEAGGVEEDERSQLGSQDGPPASRDGLAAVAARGALLHHVHHVGHVQRHVVTGTHKCIVTDLGEREVER